MVNYFENTNNLSNSNSSLPNMSNTITPWFLDISFQVVDRVLNGAYWEDGEIHTVNTRGVVQPPRDIDLKIFPQGTWSWQWMMLHCLPDVMLNTNQFVIYDGIKYKVMNKKDWTKYGYIRYMLLEAYQAQKLEGV